MLGSLDVFLEWTKYGILERSTLEVPLGSTDGLVIGCDEGIKIGSENIRVLGILLGMRYG